MTATYTPESPTDRDKVRLLAADTDVADPFFTDEEIALFLSLEGSNIRRASAMALEAIAGQQVLLLKKLTLLNQITTDGPAVAAALRARAKELREQASESEIRAGSVFDVAEMSVNEFTDSEILYNAVLRGGA